MAYKTLAELELALSQPHDEKRIIDEVAATDNVLAGSWVLEIAQRHHKETNWKLLHEKWGEWYSAARHVVSWGSLNRDALATIKNCIEPIKNIINQLELNSVTRSDARILAIIIQGLQLRNRNNDEANFLYSTTQLIGATQQNRQQGFQPIADAAIGLSQKLKTEPVEEKKAEVSLSEEKKADGNFLDDLDITELESKQNAYKNERGSLSFSIPPSFNQDSVGAPDVEIAELVKLQKTISAVTPPESIHFNNNIARKLDLSAAEIASWKGEHTSPPAPGFFAGLVGGVASAATAFLWGSGGAGQAAPMSVPQMLSAAIDRRIEQCKSYKRLSSQIKEVIVKKENLTSLVKELRTLIFHVHATYSKKKKSSPKVVFLQELCEIFSKQKSTTNHVKFCLELLIKICLQRVKHKKSLFHSSSGGNELEKLMNQGEFKNLKHLFFYGKNPVSYHDLRFFATQSDDKNYFDSPNCVGRFQEIRSTLDLKKQQVSAGLQAASS